MAMRVRYTVLDGEVISETRGGVERDYVPDPLGSTVALLDNTQTQTDTFTYWPYGEVRTRTGSTATPLQFVGPAGYYRDSASRTYVRARYLDTAKGRWMNQDPIEFYSEDANLYRYVANNPLLWMDPTGEQIPYGHGCHTWLPPGIPSAPLTQPWEYEPFILPSRPERGRHDPTRPRYGEPAWPARPGSPARPAKPGPPRTGPRPPRPRPEPPNPWGDLRPTQQEIMECLWECSTTPHLVPPSTDPKVVAALFGKCLYDCLTKKIVSRTSKVPLPVKTRLW